MLQVWGSLLIYVHGRVNPSDVISWAHACSIFTVSILTGDSIIMNFKLIKMDELQSNTNQPDFSTMAKIMEHFYNVPFEQFQQELNDWFSKALLEKGIDPQNIQINGVTSLFSLPELISKIYHQAELFQTISESKINLSDESN
jgi:hypothetical protein